jgi:hypothetical protein
MRAVSRTSKRKQNRRLIGFCSKKFPHVVVVKLFANHLNSVKQVMNSPKYSLMILVATGDAGALWLALVIL